MNLVLHWSHPFSDERIMLPYSKSISNRLLIMQALSKAPIRLSHLSASDDTRVLQTALHSDNEIIDIGHAGTAMRFSTAYFAAIAQRKTITGSSRMQERPIGALVDALQQLEAQITYEKRPGFPPLTTSGFPLSGHEITISGSISSQYISALLLIAPTLSQGLALHIQLPLISRPYVRMTLALMAQAGIQYQVSPETPDSTSLDIFVPHQAYQPASFTIEPDWSSASYWYEIVALSPYSRVHIADLSPKSLQGDAKVAQLFDTLGVQTDFVADGIWLSHKTPTCTHFTYDFTEQPDLVQTLAVTLCFLHIPFTFSGTQSLHLKETDRILALQQELGKFGFVLSTPAPGILTSDAVAHTQPKSTVSIATYRDHRMAMAFAPIALKVPELIIEDAEVVSKSYPDFWKDTHSL